MTAATLRIAPPGEVRPALRLIRLHLASRRVPAALLALVACGVVLRVALNLHWVRGSGITARQLPVFIEAAAASIVAITTHSPFGEPERATGRWLPWLRLGTAVAVTGFAIGMLAAGAAAGQLPGGTLDIVRNVAGVTGIGLLSAAAFGGVLAWIGPMTYLVVADLAVLRAWTTPWTWPARPPHDRGAALCAAAVFVAGIAITAIRGARDSASD